MNKRVFKWMVGVLISSMFVLAYLFLFKTHLFSGITLRLANRYILESQGLELRGKLTGGMAAHRFGVTNATIIQSGTSDTLASIAFFELQGGDLSWGLSELSLEEVSVKNFFLDLDVLEDLQRGETTTQPSMNIVVRDAHIEDGRVEFTQADSVEQLFVHTLAGNIWSLDGFSGINIRNGTFTLPTVSGDTVSAEGRVGLSTLGQIDLEALKLQTAHNQLDLNGTFNGDTIRLAMLGQDIPVSQFLEVPEFYRDMTLDTDLSIERIGDRLSILGSGSIHQAGTRVPFEIYRLTLDGNEIKTLGNIGTEFSYLGVLFERNSSGNIRGNFDLFRPELDSFIPLPDLSVTEAIGKVRFSGDTLGFQFEPEIEQVVVNGIELSQLKTRIRHHGLHHVSIDTSTLRQGENRLQFHGEIKDGKLAISSTSELSDYSFLDDLIPNSPLEGDLSLGLEVKGTIEQPQFQGSFQTSGWGVKERLEITGLGKFDLILHKEGVQGEFAVQGDEGFLFRDSLQQFSIATSLGRDAYYIDDLHLQGRNNLISISGGFHPQGIDLDKFKMIANGHVLDMVDSVRVQRDENGNYLLPPSVMAFNMGGASVRGQYHPETGYDLVTEFELLDLEELMEFLRLKVDFKGIASGSSFITGDLRDPVIQGQFDLLNGSTLGYPSDSAQVDITVTNDKTTANEIIAYSQGGRMKLTGDLPWGYGVRGDALFSTAQNFSIIVEDYDLADLKFTSIAGLTLTGKTTGSVTMRGTPTNTKMDGRLDLFNATYDLLDFSRGYMEFGYEDNLMTFDSLSMVSTWGYGSGSGYMPISLDMIAEDRLVAKDRDMGMQFEFNLNEMPFLSRYISAIDAIEGDYMGNLTFTGPFSAPLRNGNVRGHNGYLEVSILGNPITEVHSEVTLKDNTMTIDHFSGRMKLSKGSTLTTQGVYGFTTGLIEDLIGMNVAQEYQGRVSASGEIDFDTFFEPIFDVEVKAEEVYYRSTDGLIEAIADGELQFTGQDTLDVTAIIPVKRAAYYSNFESTESYQEAISQVDSSLFKYSLNTQFPSDLLISNDQLEAEFEGELWLLDYGDGIMRFSGTLNAQEGGKFFYLGNELSILSGEIIFNSVDFNPQVDIEASIEIDGELVTIQLSGDLDEPELIINANSGDLTQSDVLAYLTINQTLVEVSFDTQTALNPVRNYTEMFAEKQLSKIARESLGLDILDVGINLDSDTTAVSRFEVGQRLSKNLKVTYGGELDPSSSSNDFEYDFGLEYQINRNVSVTSKFSPNGEIELNGRLKFTY